MNDGVYISNQGFQFHHYSTARERIPDVQGAPQKQRKNSTLELQCDSRYIQIQDLTLSEINSSHLPESHPKKERIVFQPSIFRCEMVGTVSFREGK